MPTKLHVTIVTLYGASVLLARGRQSQRQEQSQSHKG